MDTVFFRERLDEAKRRVGICEAASYLGIEGLRPDGSFRSPLREDRHASFSITADRLWHDHATGDGGDVVSFVRVATGCEIGEAIKRVIALAGLDADTPLPAPSFAQRRPSLPRRPKRDALRGLELRLPAIGELVIIQHTRRWPVFAGLEIAARRGLLCVAHVRHCRETHTAWIMTDNARKTAQARRLDGEQWAFFENKTSKSISLRSDHDHPPGLNDIVCRDRPVVLLCEGEPDTLAALLLAWLAGCVDRVGVLCLPGATRSLPPTVLSALTGRRVRILRQFDKPRPDGVRVSHKAALAWLESLIKAGIDADLVSVDGLICQDGKHAKDIADLCAGADLEHLGRIAAAVLRGLEP